MGVPTSEVGYNPAMPRREDHEVHKRTCGGNWGGGIFFFRFLYRWINSWLAQLICISMHICDWHTNADVPYKESRKLFECKWQWLSRYLRYVSLWSGRNSHQQPLWYKSRALSLHQTEQFVGHNISEPRAYKFSPCIGSSFFGDIAWRRLLLGKTYRSYRHGSILGLLSPRQWDRYFVPKRR